MSVLGICHNCFLMLLILGEAGRAQTQQLTMARAVETALSRHQAIQAAGARIAGAEGLKQQAGLRPNPEFFLHTENWRFTGTPGFQPGQNLDLFAYLSQPLEMGGKRIRRVESAQSEIKVVELEKRLLEWRVRQDVRQAFLRALMLQKQLEIMEENGRYFEQIVDYHRVRVEQGAMAEADLIKVRLEQERLSLAQGAAQAEAERGRADLLRAMGVTEFPQGLHLEDEGAPAQAAEKHTASTLLEKAHASRIEVLLGQAMIDRAQAQVANQQALAKPDWNFLFGYKRSSGYDTILAGIAVPLPVFNRNEGNILHSQAEVDRARFLLKATQAQMDADLNTALAGLRRRHAMLRQMERGMIERAEQSWRISLAAYQEGGADLLRLLDAQRVRNEVRLIFTRTQMEYRLSLAELESAAGTENLSLSEELLRVDP